MKKTFFSFLILGLASGVFLTFSPGGFFVISLAVICGFLILRGVPQSERRFVIRMFIAGLALRMIISVGLDLTAFICFKDAALQKVEDPYAINPSIVENLINEKTRIFFKMGDSDYHSLRGYVYTAYAKGFENAVTRHYLSPKLEFGYGWSAYLYIIGLFYYLFDYSPVAVKFLNCLFGALGAIFIYKIGLEFSKTVGRSALLMVMFFPSLVIWSTANFKGEFSVLLSAGTIWFFIIFLKTKKNRFLVISLLGIIIQFWYSQIEIALILLAAILLSFIIMLLLRKRIILILLFVIAGIFLLKNIHMRENLSIRSLINRAYVRHIGHIDTGGKTYKFLDDKYYLNTNLVEQMKVTELIPSVIKSIWHFLFEPFPSRMTSLYFLIVYIQMVVWYLLVFFTFIGVIRGTIYGAASYLPLFFYVAIGTVAIAMSSGNIGTLLRHRDIISPFYFVFAAIGIACIFKKE